MSYYLVFLIVFVFWISIAYLLKKSLVRVSAPANFFMTFVLYTFGLFKRLDIGMYVFFAIVSLITVIAATVCIKNKDIKSLGKIVFSPVSILFFVAGIFLGLVFTNMMSYHWDEMTHWALVVKNMFEYDNFGNLGDTTTMFNQYVPATGVFMYAFQFFGDTFINGHLYAAFDVLLLSMMLPITELFKNKLSLRAIIATLAFMLWPCVLKFTLYCELLVDGLLGVSLAYLYLTYITDKNNPDYFTILTLALGAFFITQIKSTGIVMVIFGILYITVDVLTRNREKINYFIKKKSNIAMMALFVFMIVFAKVSWSMYIDANDVRAGWDSSELTMGNLIKYITEPDEFQQTVTQRFFKTFFIGKFYYEYGAYLQIPQILMFAIIGTVSFLLARKMKNKAFGIANTVYSIVIIFGFGIAMLILYIFSFSYRESLGIAAYPRYMSAMTIGVMLVLATQIIEVFVKPVENAKALEEVEGKGITEYRYGVKKLVIATIAYLVVAASFTAGLNAYIEQNVLPVKVAYGSYKEWIEITAKLDDTDSVYYAMHDYLEDDVYVRRYIKIRFFCTPTRCSGFTEGGSYASGRDTKIFLTGNPFSMTFSAEKFEEETAPYKYLFIDKVSQKFIEQYGSLFEETPKAKVLYLRTEKDGKTVFTETDID